MTARKNKVRAVVFSDDQWELLGKVARQLQISRGRLIRLLIAHNWGTLCLDEFFHGGLAPFPSLTALGGTDAE